MCISVKEHHVYVKCSGVNIYLIDLSPLRLFRINETNY